MIAEGERCPWWEGVSRSAPRSSENNNYGHSYSYGSYGSGRVSGFRSRT